MAASSRSLAWTCLTVTEFARGVGRHTLTVRRWFEDDPHAIRTPRGGQRDQILIPIDYALAWCQKKGIPEQLVQMMIEEHRISLTKPVPPPPVTTAISRANLRVTTSRPPKQPKLTKVKSKPKAKK